ncbi:MAG: hypothetical protein KGL39_14320 [Patescibacteria group bacterium]|nr:hypothetical protein [Patescibacteria group bacterium]
MELELSGIEKHWQRVDAEQRLAEAKKESEAINRRNNLYLQIVSRIEKELDELRSIGYQLIPVPETSLYKTLAAQQAQSNPSLASRLMGLGNMAIGSSFASSLWFQYQSSIGKRSSDRYHTAL